VAADVSEEAVDPIVIAAVTVNQYIYVVLNMLKIQNWSGSAVVQFTKIWGNSATLNQEQGENLTVEWPLFYPGWEPAIFQNIKRVLTAYVRQTKLCWF